MVPSMSLRILQIISSPAAGGAEVYVKDLAIELARTGATVFVGFVSRAADIGRSREYEEKFLADLDAADVPYFFLGHECRRNPLLGAWRVRQFCTEHGVSVYHSHLKYAIAFGMLLRIPRVHTHHNIVPKAGRFMYALFNLFVEAYVGISAICADKLAEFTGRSVTTIFNGVNPAKLQPYVNGPRYAGEPLQCIAVGRIQEQKNYALLVEALSLLPPDIRAALHVSVAGEGPADTTLALRTQIAEAGLESTVSLLGNRNDVPQLLGQAQLFLMSSAWEGLPIALIEASLSGLPCIVTDVGGCSEVIDVCRNGIVVPPADAAAFARALASLVRDPATLHQFSCNALEKSDVFTIRAAASDHVSLYGRLCPGTHSLSREKLTP